MSTWILLSLIGTVGALWLIRDLLRRWASVEIAKWRGW
jgi:hypothetical protein